MKETLSDGYLFRVQPLDQFGQNLVCMEIVSHGLFYYKLDTVKIFFYLEKIHNIFGCYALSSGKAISECYATEIAGDS